MAESSTLVITAVPNPDEAEALQQYQKEAGPMFMAAGGQPARRLRLKSLIAGEPFGILLLMDFPSTEAIEKVFDSEEYKAIIPLRDKGVKKMTILIADEM